MVVAALAHFGEVDFELVVVVVAALARFAEADLELVIVVVVVSPAETGFG